MYIVVNIVGKVRKRNYGTYIDFWKKIYPMINYCNLFVIVSKIL